MNQNNDINDPHGDLDRLIDRISDGTMSREEFAEFEARLLEDSELRRRFRARMRLEANLHSECQASPTEILHPLMQAPGRPRLSRWAIAAVAGVAAVLAIATFITFRPVDPENPDMVATIMSEESAAWSAVGMIGKGARLSPGIISLERGLARLRFESGAIVDLEAPVTIELLDPMRCRLKRGKAIFEVPESAVGFVVETPNGYAVDHGTRFAVALQEDNEHVEFGVLSGRISVHHDKSQAKADVRSGDMVLMTSAGIGVADNTRSASSARALSPDTLVFPTNGRETSIVHGDMRKDFLDPSMLMVKKDIPVPDEAQLDRLLWAKDRRSLIAFDLGELDRRQQKQASLRLNMVSTGKGYAMLLPESTTIEVYGIRDVATLEHWDDVGLKWANAPGSVEDSTGVDTSEVSLLGSFEIKRSELEGSVVFESPELNRFVNNDSTGVVAFLLVSDSIPHEPWSLVHAFATSRHVEVAGPSLEIRRK
ncbi:MAG: FecR domain-containing protein [Verrucomicrobiae bacterium]|nr:FecR domain-containing protein [Verrucomicrobiae bacterium]NNJ86354.1 hypothetical protein [Akkermansiaceae bacterium]